MGTELSQRIKAARTSAKVTQQEVAAACSTSRNSVSMWESRGEHATTPTLQNLLTLVGMLSKRLDRPVSEIAGWLLDDSSTLPPPWVLSPRRASDEATAPSPIDEALLLDAVKQVDKAIAINGGLEPEPQLRAQMIALAYRELLLFENSKREISQKLKELSAQSAKR